jgi:hypothetical protein
VLSNPRCKGAGLEVKKLVGYTILLLLRWAETAAANGPFIHPSDDT